MLLSTKVPLNTIAIIDLQENSFNFYENVDNIYILMASKKKSSQKVNGEILKWPKYMLCQKKQPR